jgi:aconitase B
LLAFINEATKKIFTREEGVKKLTPTDYIENSVSGISSDDLTATVNFLANKIKDEINLRFEELPILSRNEITLMCSLGVIVAEAFEEYDHKDLEHFINKFSGIIRAFVEVNDSDPLRH